jgi:hypothetical protein
MNKQEADALLGASPAKNNYGYMLHWIMRKSQVSSQDTHVNLTVIMHDRFPAQPSALRVL